MFNVEQAIEAIAARVHEGWMQEKLAQKFADHPWWVDLDEVANGWYQCVICEGKYLKEKHHSDMLPFAKLPEHTKEYDRQTARMVFAWLQENDWRIVHRADDLEAENEAQAAMIVEYGDTVAELRQQLADAHEAVQVMALMRQHEKEATVVDRGYISERGWNELKDENKRLNKRLSKLEAVLEQINAGG